MSKPKYELNDENGTISILVKNLEVTVRVNEDGVCIDVIRNGDERPLDESVDYVE